MLLVDQYFPLSQIPKVQLYFQAATCLLLLAAGYQKVKHVRVQNTQILTQTHIHDSLSHHIKSQDITGSSCTQTSASGFAREVRVLQPLTFPVVCPTTKYHLRERGNEDRLL